MKKNTILHLVLIALTVLALASIAADDSGRKLTATMTGAAEAPGPGDPDGSGTATITVNVGQGQVCWEIHVADITLPAIGAHIHSAPTGIAGPVVVPLSSPDETGHASGCRSVDRNLIKALMQSTEQYYVNVHTTDFPAGAVRGQLSK